MKNITSTRPLGSQYGMTPGLPGIYRNHVMSLRPLFDGSDGDGGGDGGSAGGGEGGDDGDGSGAEGDPDAALKAKAVALTSDKGYVTHGGKHYKVADLLTAVGLKDRHEKGLATMGEIAKAIRLQQEKGGRGQQGGEQGDNTGRRQGQPQGQGGEQVKDVLDELEKQDLLDGKTTAQVLRQFREGTVSPIVRALVKQQTQMKEMHGLLSQIAGERTETRFKGDIGSVITSLKLPDVDGGHTLMEEMLRDFYQSYDEESQKQLNPATLLKEFKPRFEAARKYFRALDKADGKAAQDRQRKQLFSRPAVNGKGGNGQGKRFMTNKQMADALFESTSAET